MRLFVSKHDRGREDQHIFTLHEGNRMWLEGVLVNSSNFEELV